MGCSEPVLVLLVYATCRHGHPGATRTEEPRVLPPHTRQPAPFVFPLMADRARMSFQRVILMRVTQDGAGYSATVMAGGPPLLLCGELPPDPPTQGASPWQ